MKKFAISLFALIFLISCTSSQIQLITNIVTIAETLLPLVLKNAQEQNVVQYVGQVLPILDGVLANPSAVTAAQASAQVASIAIPLLDKNASPQAQQTLANFVSAVELFLAQYPPQPTVVAAHVLGGQPKMTPKDIKQINELRGRILALEAEMKAK